MSASLASQSLIVVLAPSTVRVADEFGTGVGVVSQARSVTAVAAVVSSLFLGRLIARLGVGRAIAAGSLAAIAACVGLSISPDIGVFMAAHVVVGLAVAALLSAPFTGAAACGDSTPRALGLVAGANSLAWIAVNPLSGLRATHDDGLPGGGRWRELAEEFVARLGLVHTGATGTGARELIRAEHERAQRTGTEFDLRGDAINQGR